MFKDRIRGYCLPFLFPPCWKFDGIYGARREDVPFFQQSCRTSSWGMPAAVVVTAAVFGALSGSSIATVVAVGSMAIPQMIKMGYSKENSYGVLAASGTLGQMIPPSIFMILFAASTQLDPGALFLAGIVPGIFLAVVLIIVAVIVGLKEEKERRKRAEISGNRKILFTSDSIPVNAVGHFRRNLWRCFHSYGSCGNCGGLRPPN